MKPSDYLGADVPPLNVKIVECAHDDIGEGEDILNGQGTNRSEYVDHVNSRFGSPLGSYWCANDVGGWWEDAGADIPPDNVGSAETWHLWAKKTGRFRTAPYPGYAILYGTPAHVDHITIVARLVPDATVRWGVRVLEIGGNTSLGVYNRDGWTVAEKILDASHLVGFVSPNPLDGRP